MPAKNVKAFLDERGIKYVTILHSPAYTAQEIAASAHIPGKQLAKTVIITMNGDLAMAVLPASSKIDFMLLGGAVGTEDVALAEEHDFEELFPGCEAGAMPPFGNFYGIPVFVAAELTEDERIAFNAGTFTELIQMSYSDFARLVDPIVLHFAYEMA
ncbi:MAG: YbaK/EbsC family protein [Rhodothermales bacterium]